jgi:hypothetical protein
LGVQFECLIVEPGYFGDDFGWVWSAIGLIHRNLGMHKAYITTPFYHDFIPALNQAGFRKSLLAQFL